MPNIAFYFTSQISPTCGGVERVTTSIISELLKYGFNYYVFFRIQNNSLENIPNQIQIPEDDFAGENNISFITSQIIEKKIQLLINLAAIMNHSSICAVEACKRSGIPHISVYHNTFEMPLWMNAKTSAMMKNKYLSIFPKLALGVLQRLPFYKGGNYIHRHSARAVVLAQCYINEYRKYISRDISKVVSIYNPIPFHPDSISQCKGKKNIALFVGRLSKQKGLDFLIKAWAKCKPRNYVLKIVGSGDEEQNLKALVDELNIDHSISFEGHQNPESYYKEARIFCMTSEYEGYPMTLIEAQAFGCVPVITDSFTAAKEIISDQHNGFISKRDLDSYANVLQYAIGNPEKLSIIADNCQQEIIKYDNSKIGKKWIELINDILAK